MVQEVTPAKTFCVIVAGRTNGAHEHIVEWLRNSGLTELSSPENSRYLLVFCPVASRVGTDIGEALQDIPDGKEVILVVMHHTFDCDHTIANSKRQVDKNIVGLTVDCLFHEGRFLSCKRNDTAWNEIQEFLGLPGSPDSICPSIAGGCKRHRGKIVAAGIFALGGWKIIPAVHHLLNSDDDLFILECRQHFISFKWCKKHRGKIISILVIILVGGVIVPRIPAVDSSCQGLIRWCKEHPTRCCILGASAVTGLLLWMNRK